KNPYGEEAKQYLYEVINEALEHLPDHQQFLKANRTLENLLKTKKNKINSIKQDLRLLNYKKEVVKLQIDKLTEQI
ncbi:hypothetical protein OC701_02595, partial ['Bonamia sp.' little leaf phytoplasma]|nr:hypothetical protein ['Bonamia sp.' little leaf phytoplasma]